MDNEHAGQTGENVERKKAIASLDTELTALEKGLKLLKNTGRGFDHAQKRLEKAMAEAARIYGDEETVIENLASPDDPAAKVYERIHDAANRLNKARAVLGAAKPAEENGPETQGVEGGAPDAPGEPDKEEPDKTPEPETNAAAPAPETPEAKAVTPAPAPPAPENTPQPKLKRSDLEKKARALGIKPKDFKKMKLPDLVEEIETREALQSQQEQQAEQEPPEPQSEEPEETKEERNSKGRTLRTHSADTRPQAQEREKGKKGKRKRAREEWGETPSSLKGATRPRVQEPGIPSERPETGARQEKAVWTKEKDPNRLAPPAVKEHWDTFTGLVRQTRDRDPADEEKTRFETARQKLKAHYQSIVSDPEISIKSEAKIRAADNLQKISDYAAAFERPLQEKLEKKREIRDSKIRPELENARLISGYPVDGLMRFLKGRRTMREVLDRLRVDWEKGSDPIALAVKEIAELYKDKEGKVAFRFACEVKQDGSFDADVKVALLLLQKAGLIKDESEVKKIRPGEKIGGGLFLIDVGGGQGVVIHRGNRDAEGRPSVAANNHAEGNTIPTSSAKVLLAMMREFGRVPELKQWDYFSRAPKTEEEHRALEMMIQFTVDDDHSQFSVASSRRGRALEDFKKSHMTVRGLARYMTGGQIYDYFRRSVRRGALWDEEYYRIVNESMSDELIKEYGLDRAPARPEGAAAADKAENDKPPRSRVAARNKWVEKRLGRPEEELLAEGTAVKTRLGTFAVDIVTDPENPARLGHEAVQAYGFDGYISVDASDPAQASFLINTYDKGVPGRLVKKRLDMSLDSNLKKLKNKYGGVFVRGQMLLRPPGGRPIRLRDIFDAVKGSGFVPQGKIREALLSEIEEEIKDEVLAAQAKKLAGAVKITKVSEKFLNEKIRPEAERRLGRKYPPPRARVTETQAARPAPAAAEAAPAAPISAEEAFNDSDNWEKFMDERPEEARAHLENLRSKLAGEEAPEKPAEFSRGSYVYPMEGEEWDKSLPRRVQSEETRDGARYYELNNGKTYAENALLPAPLEDVEKYLEQLMRIHGAPDSRLLGPAPEEIPAEAVPAHEIAAEEPAKPETARLGLEKIREIILQKIGDKATVNRLDLTEENGILKMRGELDGGMFIGKIKVDMELIHSGGGLELGKADIDASSFVRPLINQNLGRIPEGIYDFLNKKYEKPISDVRIVDGGLEIEFVQPAKSEIPAPEVERDPYAEIVDRKAREWEQRMREIYSDYPSDDLEIMINIKKKNELPDFLGRVRQLLIDREKKRNG